MPAARPSSVDEALIVPTVARAPREAILVMCVGLGLAAALIHVEAAFDHLDDYAAYAPVFLLLAVMQTVWAIGLLREPSRRWLSAGLVLSVGVIVAWIASRTSGIPIAPKPWVPEVIGPADVAATLDETATVLAVGLILVTGRNLERWPRWGRHVAAVLGVILCVTLLLAVGGGHAS